MYINAKVYSLGDRDQVSAAVMRVYFTESHGESAKSHGESAEYYHINSPEKVALLAKLLQGDSQVLPQLLEQQLSTQLAVNYKDSYITRVDILCCDKSVDVSLFPTEVSDINNQAARFQQRFKVNFAEMDRLSDAEKEQKLACLRAAADEDSELAGNDELAAYSNRFDKLVYEVTEPVAVVNKSDVVGKSRRQTRDRVRLNAEQASELLKRIEAEEASELLKRIEAENINVISSPSGDSGFIGTPSPYQRIDDDSPVLYITGDAAQGVLRPGTPSRHTLFSRPNPDLTSPAPMLDYSSEEQSDDEDDNRAGRTLNFAGKGGLSKFSAVLDLSLIGRGLESVSEEEEIAGGGLTGHSNKVSYV